MVQDDLARRGTLIPHSANVSFTYLELEICTTTQLNQAAPPPCIAAQKKWWGSKQTIIKLAILGARHTMGPWQGHSSVVSLLGENMGGATTKTNQPLPLLTDTRNLQPAVH